MAPKRPSAPENPRSASSSSEEEESEELTDSDQQNPVQNQPRNHNSIDSDEEEDLESSDDESGDKDAEPNKPPSGQKLAPPASDLDDEDSESDTESIDTIPSPTASGFAIKTADDSAKLNKPAQNPKDQGSKSALKSNGKDTQKKGKSANGVGLEEKRSPIARLWGDDDELAIVRGMVEYRAKKGRDPCADRDAFNEFMKKSLKVEVTKNQLMDKIRRLRKKYENNTKKGENPVISKPHELKLFELSKKVWGGDSVGAVESSAKVGKRKADKSVKVDDLVKKENNGETSNKKAKKNVGLTKSLDIEKEKGKYVVKEGLGLEEDLKGDQAGFWDSYPHFKEALDTENSGYFSTGGKRAMEVQFYGKVGAAIAKEMEEKWKRYHVKEAKLKLFKLELVAEQTKLVIDALGNAKS